MKYTPSPWTCRRDKTTVVPGGYVRDKHNDPVAVLSRDQKDYFMGNCFMVAAAPELYESLVRLNSVAMSLFTATSANIDETLRAHYIHANDEAVKAIEKAKGNI